MKDHNRIDDRVGEMADKVKGKTNEVVGAARGDMGQELKGKGQRMRGGIRGAINDVRDERERDRIR